MKDFQPMKHLKIEELPNNGNFNWFKEMFRLQQELSCNYRWQDGKTPEDITKVFAQAISSEAQELMNNTNWKPWKEGKKTFDYLETKYEYIDILHFVIDGLLALGVTAEEAMQIYMAKNKENHDRILRGY